MTKGCSPSHAELLLMGAESALLADRLLWELLGIMELHLASEQQAQDSLLLLTLWNYQ